MTTPKTGGPIADETQDLVPVPAVGMDTADLNLADHYDVSVQTDEGGDPDRVHVTSIAPRVRT